MLNHVPITNDLSAIANRLLAIADRSLVMGTWFSMGTGSAVQVCIWSNSLLAGIMVESTGTAASVYLAACRLEDLQNLINALDMNADLSILVKYAQDYLAVKGKDLSSAALKPLVGILVQEFKDIVEFNDAKRPVFAQSFEDPTDFSPNRCEWSFVLSSRLGWAGRAVPWVPAPNSLFLFGGGGGINMDSYEKWPGHKSHYSLFRRGGGQYKYF